MFDPERFVADCRAAHAEDRSHKAVREVLLRALSEPGSVLKGLGEPRRAGVEALYRSPELTILNVLWAPHMTIYPHNHRMWAVIGIYTGREDNIFWRRLPGGRIEAAAAQSIGERDAAPLGRDIIHSVTNPIARLTGAIHVYGGDFFAQPRSEFDPDTLAEQPYDVARTLELFATANANATATDQTSDSGWE
jgi:predicted metal-dependent enzyme (double-stranded beta helix superfamily)